MVSSGAGIAADEVAADATQHAHISVGISQLLCLGLQGRAGRQGAMER